MVCMSVRGRVCVCVCVSTGVIRAFSTFVVSLRGVLMSIKWFSVDENELLFWLKH